MDPKAGIAIDKAELKRIGQKIMNSALSGKEQLRLLGNIGIALKSRSKAELNKAMEKAEMATSYANEVRPHGNINMSISQLEDAIEKSILRGKITKTKGKNMLADIKKFKLPKTAEAMKGRKFLTEKGLFKKGPKAPYARRIRG